MDGYSAHNLGESSQSSTLGYPRDSLAVNNSSPNLLSTCALCHRILASDNETGDLEIISVCGDCKFLLLEDLQTTSPDVYPRRMPISRRRYDSSESVESIFSQQFSQMITLARQNQSMVFDHDNQSVDGDGAARLMQRTSSRTTPSGSRRWRRVFSDTESDGFDSLYGESESNVSFRRYRAFHGEADTLSYSAYGGDSDASMDGQSFLDSENFGHPNGGSEIESDTDIDPMNAGLYHWNSEDEEEEDEGEDDSEWEEAQMMNTLDSLRAGAQLHGSSRMNGSNVYINWRRQFFVPEVEGRFGIGERIQAHTGDLLTNLKSQRHGIMLETLEITLTQGLRNLLEHLAETESSKEAPPASLSFVYMPSSLFSPLPPFLHLAMHDVNDDSSLDATYDGVMDEPSQLHHGREQREVLNADSVGVNGVRDVPRNRWFFLAAAAAPIVSMVGISLMLWFRNPSADRRCTVAISPTVGMIARGGGGHCFDFSPEIAEQLPTLYCKCYKKTCLSRRVLYLASITARQFP
ncbi:UNVERIFIED_CONTAM: hypothetical protein Slati_1643700 [Sesamum latifolium]|uniref:Uncharacterized protein n=1 Tax=Sesamum latifolium TaxID=2727402 RepID=A0AAW2XAK1_9LAMI